MLSTIRAAFITGMCFIGLTLFAVLVFIFKMICIVVAWIAFAALFIYGLYKFIKNL